MKERIYKITFNLQDTGTTWHYTVKASGTFEALSRALNSVEYVCGYEFSKRVEDHAHTTIEEVTNE